MSSEVEAMILGIDHVGYAVPDLEAALALHARLGWRLTHREENPDQGVVEAMLTAGDGQGAQLQLLAPLTADSPIARFLDRRGPGVQQVAYRVSDLAAVTAGLTAEGFSLVYPDARPGTAGSKINFIPPDQTQGVLIELIEPYGGGAVHASDSPHPSTPDPR